MQNIVTWKADTDEEIYRWCDSEYPKVPKNASIHYLRLLKGRCYLHPDHLVEFDQYLEKHPDALIDGSIIKNNSNYKSVPLLGLVHSASFRGVSDTLKLIILKHIVKLPSEKIKKTEYESFINSFYSFDMFNSNYKVERDFFDISGYDFSMLKFTEKYIDIDTEIISNLMLKQLNIISNQIKNRTRDYIYDDVLVFIKNARIILWYDVKITLENLNKFYYINKVCSEIEARALVIDIYDRIKAWCKTTDLSFDEFAIHNFLFGKNDEKEKWKEQFYIMCS